MRQLELITSHTPEIRKDCFLLSVANVKGMLGFSVPSIILADLLGNTSLLVICLFLSTLFCFRVSRFVACDSPVSGNIKSTSFLRRFF